MCLAVNWEIMAKRSRLTRSLESTGSRAIRHLFFYRKSLGPLTLIHQSAPCRRGLRWIAHGFSTLGLSDHEILDREFIVYDALYAECRKRAER